MTSHEFAEWHALDNIRSEPQQKKEMTAREQYEFMHGPHGSGGFAQTVGHSRGDDS